MVTDEMVDAAYAEWTRLRANGVLGIAAMREALRAAQGVRPVAMCPWQEPPWPARLDGTATGLGWAAGALDAPEDTSDASNHQRAP
jgi:hypothetical protein